MNHAYRLVWNETAHRYVPAPETAKGRGKSGTRSAVVAAALCAAVLGGGSAWAAPAGGAVSAGSGSISHSGATTTITQASQNLAINWASFGIAAGERVNFVQPGASAIALNRVVGAESSVINGSLSANGQVWILNPNGVLFGHTASVNVGGLVASTLSLSDADFLAGKRSFSANGSQGTVVNQGSLSGGYVALLGKQASNSGTITTANGTAALAAGDKVTLDFSGNRLLSVQVDEGTLNALAENKGLIRADNGTVILSASAKEALLATVVNNEGVIEAKGIDAAGGTIVLLGGFNGGTVQVAGTLDASASGSHNGGFIETSGAHVQVAGGAKVRTLSQGGKTGTWLVDPTDFTVSAGSASQAASGIGADTLSANLATTSVTLATDASNGTDSGDIHVNAAVSWSANTTLTLNAYNDIRIHAPITATGTSAGLVLNHGNYASTGTVAGGTDYHVKAPITLSGANATLGINGTAYTLLRSMAEIDAIDSTGLNGNYALAQDLDAGGITYGSALVGTTNTNFNGRFAGLGHTISNLVISAGTADYVGLFATNVGTIRDLGLVGGSVSGRDYVGSLTGINSGSVSNAYATGSVSGIRYVGGLVGYNSGSIGNAYATGSVNANHYAGGLVGWNDGSIDTAYATGSVNANYYAGGLVGVNYDGSIGNAYATGSVSASGDGVGGLAGYNTGSIGNSYWDSGSTGQSAAMQYNYGSSTNVSAVNSSSAFSHASYANLGTWSETANGSGVWVANDGTKNTWVMVEGSTRPFLYSEYSTTIRNAHQLQLMALDTSASYTLSGNINASETSGSNASGMWTTAGFASVGSTSDAFTGSLNGSGHMVNDLTINRSSDFLGLIGYAENATLQNIGVVGGSISGGTGNYYVGGLVGWLNGGTVSNAYSTASVSGGENVGGLVGVNWGGAISDAYATGTVTGSMNNVGGLVGTHTGSLANVYATGTVTGAENVGGLAGKSIDGGSISNAYATGSVNGGEYSVGGLVGANSGTIRDAHATGGVSGDYFIGGLVGNNSGNIDSAYATGSVSGFAAIGGLVGASNGNIDSAYATGSVSAYSHVGGLVGANSGTIRDAYATGSVSGDRFVGGLVGFNADGSISNVFASGDTRGVDAVGGLVGYNTDGRISDALAIGNVHGDGYDIGGLVGSNYSSTISNAYATGNVSGGAGSDSVGGLVGADYFGGNISNVYATGSVSGNINVGGLLGWSYQGSLSNAYATGSVSGNDVVGGLIGYAESSSISNTYSSGAVSGTSNAGGLLGSVGADVTVTSSYWNTTTSGQGTSAGGTGLTSAQMMQASSFSGWDLATSGGSTSVWRIYEGYTAPLLRSFMIATTVAVGSGSWTYDGAVHSVSPSYSADASVDTSLIGVGNAGYINAGTYSLGTHLYSGQEGYDISYTGGTLTIDRAALTVIASNDSRVAGGSAYSGGNGVSYSGFVAGEGSGVLGGNLVYGGTSQGATAAGSYSIAASGLSASNYVLSYVDGTLMIDAAPVTPSVPATPVTPTAPAAPAAPTVATAPAATSDANAPLRQVLQALQASPPGSDLQLPAPLSTPDDETRLLAGTGTLLHVQDCGVRLTAGQRCD